MITKEELRELQLQLLEHAKVFHAFCEENHLTYYLAFGNALGCIRHGGFVPWDYDIDFVMPRNSYDKFGELCLSGKYPEGYQYSSYSNNENHKSPHALLYINQSVIQYRDMEPMPLYLDIFPLDIAPQRESTRKRQARKIALLRKMAAGKRCKKRSGQTFGRVLLKRLARITLAPISFSSINRWIDNIAKAFNSADSGYLYIAVCINKWNDVYRLCYPRDYFSERIIARFEDALFFVPAGVKGCLEITYGNYMELPPFEERERYRSAIEKFI